MPRKQARPQARIKRARLLSRMEEQRQLDRIKATTRGRPIALLAGTPLAKIVLAASRMMRRSS